LKKGIDRKGRGEKAMEERAGEKFNVTLKLGRGARRKKKK